jgi:hypothetical protein
MAAKAPASTAIAIRGACTEIARRSGRQCKQAPRDGTDRCRSHARPPRTALTAASARMSINGVGWKTWRFGDQAWQLEAWRMYDVIGEMRKFANTIGAQVSKCRLYVAEINENGDPGKEVEDPKIAALAQGPLGKGPKKDEALRLLGTNLSVAGEAYIVAEADGAKGGEDLWYVVSGSEIQQAGNRLIITRAAQAGLGGELEFREDVDLLIRCWTPHPRRTMWADSSVRAAIPVLRKIETTMKRSFAELDSRLTGAGVLVLPQNIDFPRGDGAPGNIDGLAQVFMNTAAASIDDRASSEAMVPILITAPPDSIDKIKHLTFWSDISDKIQEMEDASIRRLAVNLDIPPEILMGVGDSNHWNAWAADEANIKIFIEPILQRIAEALDHGYLDAALEFMGLDPEKYTYAFDISPLTVPPDRTADALQMHGAEVISDEALRAAGDFTDDDAPSGEEQVRRLLAKAIVAKPELLENKAVQRLFGVNLDLSGLAPAPAAPPGGMSDPAAAEEPPQAGDAAAAEVAKEAPQTNPSRNVGRSEGTASLLMLANYAMTRALGVAGSRLVPHTQRDQYPGVPKHGLYAQYGAVTHERAQQILRGVWADLRSAATVDPELAALDVDRFEQLLNSACVDLLTRGRSYDPQELNDALSLFSRQLFKPAPVGA